jgi:beta-galactosidase
MRKLPLGAKRNCLKLSIAAFLTTLAFTEYSGTPAVLGAAGQAASPRTRLLITDDWCFTKGDPPNTTTSLLYDVRPAPASRGAEPAVSSSASADVVKSWILPAGNNFLKDPDKRAKRPEGNLGNGVAYAAADFDDSSWKKVDLPHDYAIEGPFTTTVSGSTGRLPSSGVVWYRKILNIPTSDTGKSIFLDIDGAMSYSMVWLNGQFVGGWPYGYASYRLNLTPFVKLGGTDILSWAASLSGPAGIIWESRRPLMLRAVLISASSIWQALRRTDFIYISRIGVRSFPWRTSCRIGLGRTAPAS